MWQMIVDEGAMYCNQRVHLMKQETGRRTRLSLPSRIVWYSPLLEVLEFLIERDDVLRSGYAHGLLSRCALGPGQLEE